MSETKLSGLAQLAMTRAMLENKDQLSRSVTLILMAERHVLENEVNWLVADEMAEKEMRMIRSKYFGDDGPDLKRMVKEGLLKCFSLKPKKKRMTKFVLESI